MDSLKQEVARILKSKEMESIFQNQKKYVNKTGFLLDLLSEFQSQIDDIIFDNEIVNDN